MSLRPTTRTAIAVFVVAMLASASHLTAQSGPQDASQKGEIVAIRATGSPKYTEAQIVAASGLKVGDPAGREEIQAAADRLAQLGPFTSAQYRFTSRGEDITVEFEVNEAPTFPVSFDNFPWFTDAELTEALKQRIPLFNGTAPEQGAMLDEMKETLQKLLATRGVNAAVERTFMAQPASDAMMQQFKVVGAGLKVNAVKFADALAAESKRVQERVSDLVGKPYSEFAVEVFAHEHVRPIYLEHGHLRVRVGKPEARFTGDPRRPLPDDVLVIVPIEPGPAYRWSDVRWNGQVAFEPAALTELIGIKKGEVASGMKIAAAWQRVESEYGRRGYLDVKLEPKPVFDDKAKQVSFYVDIIEGPLYRMGEIVITGLSLAAERRLMEAWRVPRGQIFDRVYFDEFIATGIKKAFADTPIHYENVGQWLRTNPEARTVDVLLDFK